MTSMASTTGTEIKMNNFVAEELLLRRQMLSAVETVMNSGRYILGKEVGAFEEEWANQCRTQFCVGVANGMDAIEIAIRALNIGRNDEVITTPVTAFATVLAIMRAGATPVLADIDPDTAMLDPESVFRCLNSRTKAIVTVHLYGQVGPISELASIAKNHNIQLLEDCAQAHGASYHGQPAGSFGAAGTWSFYPTKNLGALGDAGAITTSSKAFADRVRVLRNYGQNELHQHQILGMNSRLDELQAAILRTRLPYLERWTRRRREIAARYCQGIKHSQIRLLPAPDDPSRHVYHLFVIRSAERKALQDHLKAQGVESLIHYPIPAHRQEPCRSLPHDPLGLKHAEQHTQECLSLPCHPNLNDEDVDTVIRVINTF
jgi:dTDP-4-amino-4,6-dideoxygalactose transaminase